MPNQYLPPVIAIPSTLIITNISRSAPMVITFTVPPNGANTYIIGQVVRLTVPKTYSMYQADGLTGRIVGLGVNTMSLSIDSTLFDTFSIPSGNFETPASLSPAGSQNLQFNNTTDQVGFQSLNNIGN